MFPNQVQSITIGDTRLVLWHMGKKSYQIETTRKSNTEVFNFDSDHNHAVCELIMRARELNNVQA